MSKYQNYVPQPLAFYKQLYAGDRQYQNFRLDQCKGDLSTWRFVVVAQSPGASIDNPRLRIPPFHIKRSTGLGAAVTSFKLIALDGQLSDTTLATTGFSVNNLNDTPTLDAIIYDGNVLTPDVSGLPVGRYYLTVQAGSATWYSEVFEIEGENSLDATFPESCGALKYVRLGWSPGCTISETIHVDSPSFSLFLPVNIGQPEYDYKPESEDDGQGGKTITFQRLEKRWKFFIVAPEYIADALASTQMMASVAIDFESGDSIICRDIEVDVDWETPCFAKITFAFSADILSKTACCG